ncbi:tetraether lipid synthase Tes, intein-containing [Thermococcus celer]|uniref:Molybdenum cofactor biosynthesis protein MoaA n=1 Tax=Thermococcus celer Vu 13 = JCM 8558 TaxID=1293037 RepID=A0A218P2S1_THECE|nr:radical SAM protein [Thermococcus celer]ASI99203.1 molybdenum cofactor biosynthesis protein MoaA [Thermococcus celer Vu 13 = JCM 8558]
MAENVGEVPSGEKEFEQLTRRIRDVIEFPEIGEDEFEKMMRRASRAYGGPLPHRTYSLCPETRRVVPALVWEKDGRVWITKRCPEGMITGLYYESVEQYYRFQKWRYDFKITSSNVENTGANCPLDCGLCSRHRSHTSLINIVLTNRCNLSCWYCFPPDEEAVFKVGNEVSLLKFGDLAKRFSFENKVEIDGFKGEYSTPDDIHVLTFEDGEARWTKVTKFLRRRHEGKILRIRTGTGRTLRVTPEHKVFVHVDGKLVKKRADELKPGDELLSTWRIPESGAPYTIDLIEAFKSLPEEEKEKTYVRGIGGIDLSPLKEEYGDRIYSWKSQDSMPLSAFYKLNVPGEFRLGRDATDYELPSKLEVTPPLARLIGYFVSDGHYTDKDVRITVGHKDVEEEILSILKELKLPHSILEAEGKAKQIVIGSRLVRLVFKYALGIPEKAENKRLPRDFLNYPYEVRAALLSGLLNGDGYVVRGERHLNIGYASVSRGLIRDVLYLLASFGIFARVYEVKKEKVAGANHDLYKVYVAGKDLERLIEVVELGEGHRERLGEVGARKPARITKVSDFYLDPVKSIEEEDYSGYVYDIEVESPGHSFVASDGLLVSNCFFYAKEGQPIYEPTLEQIRMMLRNAKKEQPIGANAVQLTGGEPTLRDDLIEIIRIAREEGYDHVQLNTDGIKLAFEPELVKKIREAGVNTLYMSYDGMTPQTNWKNHWEVPLIFDNVRKAGGPGIVLVPTTIRNVNDHELGAMINFALNHLDIVRGVNFQPISLVGRVPKRERQRFRITIPGAIERIEEQTHGAIAQDDWYPIPIAGHIARFFEVFAGSKYYMTSHYACGAATYAFLDRENKRVVPISRFLDVEGFVEFLESKAEEIEQWKKMGKLRRLKLGAEIFMKFKSFYDDKYAPKGLSVLELIKNAFVHGNYDALGKFHTNALFLGMMHFMDEYNYDVERVERCVIHYAMPDGRIVPFCTFNVIPELYRDKVQAQFSYSWEEWKALHPDWDYRKDKYIRTKEFVEKMKKSELYRKTYIDIEDYLGVMEKH